MVLVETEASAVSVASEVFMAVEEELVYMEWIHLPHLATIS